MGKSSHRKSRSRKSPQPFLQKGLTALVLGVGFLLMSAALSSHPLLGPAGRAIQTPAWIAIGVGLLLLGIHFLLKTKAGKNSEQPTPLSTAPTKRSKTSSANLIEPDNAIWQAGAKAPVASPPAAPPSEWSPAVFNAIEWRRFEAVCEALFAQAGFEARTQSHGPDGGVDVWLYSKHAQGPASMVQCKHWQSKPVGVKEVREFFGVMSSHQLKRGTYATTSTFTVDAVDFAKRNGIHLLDGAGLLKVIAQRSPEQQQDLLAVAFEGDYARPTCASCGTKMVERTRSKVGSMFWGCVSYPKCRTTLPMARKAA